MSKCHSFQLNREINLARLDTITHNCVDGFITKDFVQCRTEELKSISVIASDNEIDILPKQLNHSMPPSYFHVPLPFRPNIFTIRDAYVFGGEGSMTGLDGKNYYVGSCFDNKSRHLDNSTCDRLVIHNGPVFNLQTVWMHNNYFHHMTDFLPKLITLAPLIRAHPHIPILMNRHSFENMYNHFVGPIMQHFGLDITNLTLVDYDQWGKTPHYSPLVITTITRCRTPPISHIQQIRFAAFSIVGINTLADEVVPSSIVIHDREGARYRRLPQGAHIKSILKAKFGTSREVITYFGNESFRDTLKIFNNCALYIGVHSAGNTNLIFVNKKATVIEILPASFRAFCYKWISEAIGVKYVSVLSLEPDAAQMTQIITVNISQLLNIAFNVLASNQQ